MLTLAEGLRQRGHQVTIACRPGGWLPAQARGAGLRLLELDMHGPRCLRTLLTLTRMIHDEKIDIIHTHASRAAYQGFVLGLWTRRPVAASVHAMTYCYGYRQILPFGRHRVIAVSNFLREALIRQGIPPQYVRTVHNGTDVVVANPLATDEALTVRAEFNLPADAELVGVFAHLGELKGQLLLMQAAGAIVKRCPRAYFIFVGSADEGLREAFLEKAATDGLGDRLRITGFRDDMHRLMSAMDVIAVPSRMETFSMAAAEAMALGKPVVAARVGGLPEVVSDGETGLLVEREPTALANAIIALLQDPIRRAVMGRAGQERVRAHFSTGLLASRTEAVYQELLQTRRAA
jgi:glycosyltransferase involved in cell wall biosynthesis